MRAKLPRASAHGSCSTTKTPGNVVDAKRTAAPYSKTFTSGITGHAATLFMAAGSQEGSRSYVATERITGRPDGGEEEGSVTVQHGGLESDPDIWFGHIVPNTGTGGFAGWSGSARIRHDDQGAYFEIELS